MRFREQQDLFSFFFASKASSVPTQPVKIPSFCAFLTHLRCLSPWSSLQRSEPGRSFSVSLFFISAHALFAFLSFTSSCSPFSFSLLNSPPNVIFFSFPFKPHSTKYTYASPHRPCLPLSRGLTNRCPPTSLSRLLPILPPKWLDG